MNLSTGICKLVRGVQKDNKKWEYNVEPNTAIFLPRIYFQIK